MVPLKMRNQEMSISKHNVWCCYTIPHSPIKSPHEVQPVSPMCVKASGHPVVSVQQTINTGVFLHEEIVVLIQ